MIRLLSVSLVARCDSVVSCRRVRREYVSSCKLKVTRGRSYIWKPCGDIVLDPLSSCKKLEIRPKFLQNANTVFSLIASFSLTLKHILRSNQDMLCPPLRNSRPPWYLCLQQRPPKAVSHMFPPPCKTRPWKNIPCSGVFRISVRRGRGVEG